MPWAFIRLSISLAISALPMGASADTAVPEALFKAEVIVTGREEPERSRGFREGIEEIVLKLTGEYGLKNSDKLSPFLASAGSFIREFSYEDRMKNIPVHDEQGTRDRPFFLRMIADEPKLSAALAKEGLAIWTGRPEVEILLTVQDARGRFLIASEDPTAADHDFLGFRIAHMHFDGYEQREVLKSIATKRGLIIALPEAGDLPFRPASQLNAICPFHRATKDGNCIKIRGDLTILPSGRWHLDAQAWLISPELGYAGAPDCFHVQLDEVTYDEALRETLGAAAGWARQDKDAVHCGAPGRH
jgi:uncharacterized protein